MFSNQCSRSVVEEVSFGMTKSVNMGEWSKVWRHLE